MLILVPVHDCINFNNDKWGKLLKNMCFTCKQPQWLENHFGLICVQIQYGMCREYFLHFNKYHRHPSFQITIFECLLDIPRESFVFL